MKLKSTILKMYITRWGIISLLLITSCKPINKKTESTNQFAKNFSIQNTLISTYDQNGYLLSSYSIDSSPKKVAIFSSTHFGFIDAINKKTAVAIVSDKSYFYNDYVHNKKIVEVSQNENLDMEKLIYNKPDLVLLNPLPPNKNQILNSLTKANIPYLITTEHLESSPLAQAEWIKLFGTIFDQDQYADSIYTLISNNYQSNICHDTNKPTVMTSFPWNNQWYVTGSKSNFAKLISDAGGDYIVKNNKLPQNPISLEKAYNYLNKAIYWINIGTVSDKKQILTSIQHSESFPSVITSRLYNDNKRIHPKGSNDIWESGIVRPDIVLMDLKKIFSGIDSGLYYYKKID